MEKWLFLGVVCLFLSRESLAQQTSNKSPTSTDHTSGTTQKPSVEEGELVFWIVPRGGGQDW